LPVTPWMAIFESALNKSLKSAFRGVFHTEIGLLTKAISQKEYLSS